MCVVFLWENKRETDTKGEQYPSILLTFDVIEGRYTMLGAITAISKQEQKANEMKEKLTHHWASELTLKPFIPRFMVI